MPLVQIKGMSGLLSQPQKEELISKITDAVVSVEGEGLRPVIWVILEDVPSGSWGMGGTALTTDDVRALAAGKPPHPSTCTSACTCNSGSHLEVLTADTAREDVKSMLEQVRQAYGFVPNVYGIMAHAPLAVATYLQINSLLAQYSTLTPQEQQVVMLSVSAENGCEYCVAAHTVVAGMFKTPADAVQAIRDGSPLGDARLSALSAFARSLVRNRGWVPESEQQAFLDAGFTTGQVLEVVTITAMKTLSNYANHLGNPPLDEAFAAQAWKRPR